jgi:hypothetical protein
MNTGKVLDVEEEEEQYPDPLPERLEADGVELSGAVEEEDEEELETGSNWEVCEGPDGSDTALWAGKWMRKYLQSDTGPFSRPELAIRLYQAANVVETWWAGADFPLVHFSAIVEQARRCMRDSGEIDAETLAGEIAEAIHSPCGVLSDDE